MEGGYYSVVKTVNRGVGCGGPIQIVKRDCGDYVEIASLGVSFSFSKSDATSVSVMYQGPSKVDSEGRIEQLSITWLSTKLGAVSLPPIILKVPKHTNIMLVRDQVMKEGTKKFLASVKEAYDKYRMPYYSNNEVENFEDELVNHMLSMNLGV